MLRIVAVALAAAVLASAGVASAAGLETIVQDDATLLHRPAADVSASMARLHALGVDRVRLSANWSALTRDADAVSAPAGFDARDPAAYEQARWLPLDTAVRAATAAGLRVLVDVSTWAPHWATADPPGPRARTNIDPAAFANFTVAVARRYSGSFTAPPATGPPPPPSSDATLLDTVLGKPAPAPAATAPTAAPGAPLPAVDQFALWNEPNHPGSLLPQWDGPSLSAQPASAARYRLMIQAAYPAAKAVRPDATFLVGNTSSVAGRPGSGAVPPLRFIRDLACVDRKLRPLSTPACAAFKPIPGDGWAHHPYAQNLQPDHHSSSRRPDDVTIGDLPRLARLLDRLAAMGRIAASDRRIHLTEFGYETGAIAGRPTVSQLTQARWLTWAEYEASKVPAVVSFAQFLLRDQPPAAVRVTDSTARPFGQYFTGLQLSDGTDKVAARSFVAGLFVRRLAGRRVALWSRLRLGSGPRAISFQRRAGSGPWRALRTRPEGGGPSAAAVTADGQSVVARVARATRGASYRLVTPGGVAGLPVAAVRER